MQQDLAVKPPPADVGMVMNGPIEVDVTASAAAYARLHADFDAVVRREAERLEALAPDVLLADVPYTSLAAAADAGVPAVALCSLNWLDAYRAYCADRLEAARIMAEIRRAYASAKLFLQPRPHTAMAELTNTRSIPPVCRVGRNRRAGLVRALGLDPELSLVLIAFGGVSGTPWPDPPRVPGIVWLRADGSSERDDIVETAGLPLSHADLIASVDVVVTKSGYGTLCEALAAGTRVVMIGRPYWPEDRSMRDWLDRYGTGGVIDAADATPAALAQTVRAVAARPPAAPVPPAGRAVARECLLDYLP
jgi:UDP:flavonoid glycosyltransferase YjiC (YdhE family)